MAEPTTPPTVSGETRYERRDLPLAPIGWIALAIFALIVIAPLAVLAGFVRARSDVQRHLSAAPAAPRLEVDAPAHLRAYLKGEQRLLDSYGWVDRSHGIAREPISLAMQQVLQEGIDGFPKPPARRSSR